MSGARVPCAGGLRVPDLRLCAGEKRLAELRAVPRPAVQPLAKHPRPVIYRRAICREYRRARRESAEAHDESRAGGFRLCSAGTAAGSPANPHDGRVHLYYRERIFGGIYGPGFIVKNVPAAWRFMPDTTAEPPYDGAKPMLHVPILADSAKLRAMVQAMWEELPERPPKKRKR